MSPMRDGRTNKRRTTNKGRQSYSANGCWMAEFRNKDEDEGEDDDHGDEVADDEKGVKDKDEDEGEDDDHGDEVGNEDVVAGVREVGPEGSRA